MHLRSSGFSILLALSLQSGALALEESNDSETLAALLACQDITEDAARLNCLDDRLADFAHATQSGHLIILERRAVRDVERDSFGLGLQSVGRLAGFLQRNRTNEGGAPVVESFEDGSTAHYTSGGSLQQITGLQVSAINEVRGKKRVTLANGQIWMQTDSTVVPRISSRRIEDGITAEIETGAIGSHFMRLSSYPSRRFRARRVQ